MRGRCCGGAGPTLDLGMSSPRPESPRLGMYRVEGLTYRSGSLCAADRGPGYSRMFGDWYRLPSSADAPSCPFLRIVKAGRLPGSYRLGTSVFAAGWNYRDANRKCEIRTDARGASDFRGDPATRYAVSVVWLVPSGGATALSNIRRAPY